MKQEIQGLFTKLLSLASNEELMNNHLVTNAPYLLNEYGEFDLDLIVANIDKVSNLLLPGLDKYDPQDVVEALMSFDVIDENMKYQLALIFFPTNIMIEFMKYCYHKNRESFLENFNVIRDGQIEVLIELGVSYKEILPLVDNDKYFVNLYNLDKSLFDEIISKHLNSYTVKKFMPMIIEEYLNGGDYVLATVLENLHDYNNYRNDFLNLFIQELISINRFDINKLFSSLELSGLELHKFISCVTDESVMRRMIEVGGAKALIFCKDFSPEIVDLASEFTFDDYKMFDGEYKNSPALLKLVSENYPDNYPLYYCNSEAVTPETAVYFSKFGDDTISDLVWVNSKLSRNYLLQKELKSRGKHVSFYSINDLYTDINAFNFVIECFADGTLGENAPDFGNIRFAYYIFKKDYRKILDLGFRDSVSREVAEAIIDLGVNAGSYVKYFEHLDEFSNIFLEQGYSEVLFMRGVPDEYLEKHSELITYEVYLKLKETNPSFVIGYSLASKFVEQGHYDVLNDINVLEIDSTWKLGEIGLSNITYEEFLTVDPAVRKIPALMIKFMDRDRSLFDQYAKLFPDSGVVIKEKINSGDLSYEEFLELTKDYDGRFSSLVINEDVVIKYLKEGHLDFLYRLGLSAFTIKVLDYIIDNFDINNLPEKVRGKINSELVQRLIDRKDYSFLHIADYLNDSAIKKLIKSGFMLDDFVNSGYKRLDYLEYFLSRANEEKIMGVIEGYVKNDSNYLPFESSFVVKCINEGFDVDHINFLISHISVNVVELLKGLPKDKYDILNQLNINSLFINKTVADLLLNVLSTEKIKSCLAYCTDEIRRYIIRKMVSLGHNDFIDCYVSGFDQDVVKKALLSGYFPIDTALANGVFRSKITSVKFTPEELKYLMLKLDECPYLVIYFEDIISNPDLLNEYLVNEPNLLMFFSGEIVNNILTLYELYKKDKKVFETLLFRNDVTDEVIIDLYLTYDLDCKHIYNKLTHDIVSELVVKYPYLIEHFYYATNSEILKAFENGYRLNDNSKSAAVVIAFQYGFNQPGDDKYFEKLEDYDFRKILTKISFDVFDNYKDFFLDKFFKDCYSNFSFYEAEYSDKSVARYIQLTFFLYNVKSNSVTDEEKEIVLNSLIKFGHSKSFVDNSRRSFVELFGKEFLINVYLENNIHISLLELFSFSEEDKELVLSKLERDYKGKEHTVEERIEIVSVLKSMRIDGKFVIDIYDELYDLYKNSDVKDSLKRIFDIKYLYDKLMTDDSFELTLLDSIWFVEADMTQIVGNRILELLQKNVYSSDEYYSVCSWLNSNNFRDISNKLAMSSFELDPERLCYFVNNPTPEFLSELPKYLRAHPTLLDRFDIVLDDKNLVIDLIKANYFAAYEKANDALKNDIDVCKALISVRPEKISDISLESQNYRELLKIAVSKDGSLLEKEISRNQELINDIELVRLAIVTHPNIIGIVNPAIVDDSLLNLITDYSVIDFDKVEVSLFEKMLIVIEHNGLNERIVSKILAYVSNHSDNEKLLNNSIFIKCVRENLSNSELFKQIVILSKNKTVRDKLDADVIKVLEDALHILDSTGKVNILEKNPIFSYDLVKYVYPVVGLDETINLMNYTTGANEHLIRLIKRGNVDFVNSYISMLKEYNMFELNDKFIHYAFRNFDSIESLIRAVLESGRVLTDFEIDDLKKVILNNRFKISTLDELSRYDTLMVEKINNAFESNDLQSIKDYLAVFFGYGSIEVMKKQFNNFQFGNMAILRFVLNDIKEHYGEEVYNRIKITSEEMGLILLMQRIIESKDVNFLRELVDEYIINNDSDKDFYDDVQNLTAKFRLLFNYQYNSRLTKLDDKVATASEYKDTGVKIVEFNGEPFNFLAHRLFSYDSTHHGFAEMLANDPSLWTALDGASTLSCSSISDKGLYFLNNSSSNGVVYLFNELPEEFMLFMYGHDLYVEHGGHKMEPMARDNSFTDVDGLNQNTSQNGSSYNEIAGFRNGMIPCAFVCLGEEPNPETIRAAQYFSKKLGKDIPILKFNVPLYNDKKEQNYKQVVSELHNTVSVELINNCFLSGVRVPVIETTIIILETLCRNMSQGIIDEKEAIACLSELQCVINRTCLGTRSVNDAKLALNKIAALKRTIILMSTLSKEQVIKLETANMGETGIMYKYTEGEDAYLLKPAVDKQKNELQSFRAEVQEAASKLQRVLNPEAAVDVVAVGTNRFKVSKQELIDVDPDKKDYLENWVANGGPLDVKIADQLMREYVIDMLLCNFDCFAGNFVIDTSGNLRGIDKEQSFRFIDSPESLKADFSYVPNGTARIPIYQYIFQRYNSGDLEISFDPIYDTLGTLECISDEDYKAIFEDYAKSMDPDNYEEILNKIVKRKYDVTTNIRRYIDSLKNNKSAEEFRL